MSAILAALVCIAVVLVAAAVPATIIVVARWRARQRMAEAMASLMTPESMVREPQSTPVFGPISRAPRPVVTRGLMLEPVPIHIDAFGGVALPRVVVCNVTGAACPTPARCLARGCRRACG